MNGSYLAEQIMREENQKHSKIGNLRLSKTKSNDLMSCMCLICGASMDLLTNAHAEKHGYKDKKSMIKDGKIRWV